MTIRIVTAAFTVMPVHPSTLSLQPMFAEVNTNSRWFKATLKIRGTVTAQSLSVRRQHRRWNSAFYCLSSSTSLLPSLTPCSEDSEVYTTWLKSTQLSITFDSMLQCRKRKTVGQEGVSDRGIDWLFVCTHTPCLALTLSQSIALSVKWLPSSSSEWISKLNWGHFDRCLSVPPQSDARPLQAGIWGFISEWLQTWCMSAT